MRSRLDRTQIVSFEWLFPLTGHRATESGIDCHVFGVVAVAAMWLAIAISGIESARIS